jgi:type I restriction enzyme R subunit
MKSLNFEFIRRAKPELAELGALAEACVYHDSGNALVKMRSFAEVLVRDIYQLNGFPYLSQSGLFDLMSEASFTRAIPQIVRNKMDALRKQGNKAAHGEKCVASTALWVLKEAHLLAGWFYVAYLKGKKEDCGVFQDPPNRSQFTPDEHAQAHKEKQRLIKQLAEQEAKLQKLLAELEEARAKAETVAATAAEIEAASANAQQAADEFQFDEATTRHRMIDGDLVTAGWTVGDSGQDTELIRQEVKISGCGTNGEDGFAE